MADVFTKTVRHIVDACHGVTGAAFTDFDGEEIALHPKSMQDELRMCAAYGGIAIRRLSLAESKDNGGTVDAFVARWTGRTVISRRVGDHYQLVVSLEPDGIPGLVIEQTHEAVSKLEANI